MVQVGSQPIETFRTRLVSGAGLFPSSRNIQYNIAWYKLGPSLTFSTRYTGAAGFPGFYNNNKKLYRYYSKEK
jgi:hypothetical protein